MQGRGPSSGVRFAMFRQFLQRDPVAQQQAADLARTSVGASAEGPPLAQHEGDPW